MTPAPRIPGFIERFGCWALSLATIGAFFLFGAIVSFLNADALTAIQGVIASLIAAAIGIWAARARHARRSPVRRAPAARRPTRPR